MRRFRSLSRLGKLFVALTVAIVVAYMFVYVNEVREALAMDPNSYECTKDSMMKQVCDDPYGTSVFWSMFGVVLLYWPLFTAWALTGVAILVRHVLAGSRTDPT